MVEYSSLKAASEHTSIKKELLALGALDVKQESAIQKAIKESKISVTHNNNDIDTLIKQFVDKAQDWANSKLTAKMTAEWGNFLKGPGVKDALAKEGIDIAKQVDNMHKADKAQREGPVFHADIKRISMTDFMGVQGTLDISFSSMDDGIWIVEGSNGSGVSRTAQWKN
jgi:hypothetical protein